MHNPSVSNETVASPDRSVSPADVDVSLRGVTKSYSGLPAIDRLDLDVVRGEFLTLLGPSGCGKSTTLNVIAGFVEPDSGDVLLAGKDVGGLAPNKRDSAMVFQNYALFPHMTVARNVDFGLRMRKTPSSEIDQKVAEALDIVGLGGFGTRYPRQLSGGQQQRVALARAIVLRPTVLLLDEPLSNLDLKLREQLRLEIRHLQREVGITTVFVTHDQAEALVMSDRIAVMNGGRIEQLGTPTEIYQRPASTFVAGFIGQSNLLHGELADHHTGTVEVRLTGGHRIFSQRGEDTPVDVDVRVLIRPEVLRVVDATAADSELDPLTNVFRGTVREVVYLGSSVTTLVDVPGVDTPMTVDAADPSSTPPSNPGDEVVLTAPATECRVLPP